MFILDVVYHCIGPWKFSLSLSRTMSRYTSLQCSINTILADLKSLPYLLLTILSHSSLRRISTQLKFSGKPIIIDLVDKSKSFGPAHRHTGRGGRGGLQPPQNFGQLRFFGQLEKVWAKPVFKDISMFFISLKRQIFSTLI